MDKTYDLQRFLDSGLKELGIVVSGIAVSGFVTLTASQFLHVTCPFLTHLEFPCPFCGFTRAFTDTASLQLPLNFVSLIVVAPLIFLGFLIVFHFLTAHKRKEYSKTIPLFSLTLFFLLAFRYAFIIADTSIVLD